VDLRPLSRVGGTELVMKMTMTLSGPRLTRPSDQGSKLKQGAGWAIGYGICSAFQVSATQAALVVNRRVTNMPVTDFEDGADLVVFDSLSRFTPGPVLPLMRTDEVVHPDTGRAMFRIAHMSTGGFVPLGARLADGRPHPAAGTGFVLGSYKEHPADLSVRTVGPGHYWAEAYELVQLRFDGQGMRAVDRRAMTAPEGFINGYQYVWHGLSPAIPDGADLLTGLTVGPVAPGTTTTSSMIPTVHPHGHPTLGRNVGSGLCRWRYGPEGWQPSAFIPVTGPDMAFEPSLVRDADGALLMSVRGKGLKEPPGSIQDGLENTFEHFRVYRSADNGRTWETAIHLPRRRCASPVILNRTAGGRPYLAANPYESGPDSRGRPILSTSRRRTLCLWPLTADRTGVEEPVCVLDADREFGPPRPLGNDAGHDNLWMLDHPMGSVCRLADCQWHAVQCFRVTDKAVTFGGAGAADQAGAWVEEVSAGTETPILAWQFD
jgi:hypothetical protein